VDTLGLLLMVVVHSAALFDKEGARPLVRWASYSLPRLFVIYADAAYWGLWLEWADKVYTWFMQIVRRKPCVKGFVGQPKRWIVERTFAWYGRYRRLSKDYEYVTRSSEAFVYLAMSHLTLRRLSRHRHY
jgi:putative transposase